MKSPCESNKHPEYTCLIKWGVSSQKFSVEKWCKACIAHHDKTYIVQEYLLRIEREKGTTSETTPPRGRKKKAT